MLRILPFDASHADLMTETTRDQFLYHEYPIADTDRLRAGFIRKTLEIGRLAGGRSLAAVSGNTITGILSCVTDDFDSAAFGFNCYRITDLLVFSSEGQTVSETVAGLLATLKKELSASGFPYHLTFSLNNNMYNSGQIFNCLVANGFYYIHTLLTFSSVKRSFDVHDFYNGDKMTVRPAEKHDAQQVAALAKNAFRYSRFHLDPFLDNEKAGDLLKKSAENAILEKFVDVIFVAEINGKIAGYYSGKKNRRDDLGLTIGSAVISAVDPAYRGIGVFSGLDAHLLNWFAENTDFAEMGTYLANTPVHKAWITKGLGIVRAMHQFSGFEKHPRVSPAN